MTKECDVVLVTNLGMNETACSSFPDCIFKSKFLTEKEINEATKLDPLVECMDDELRGGSEEPARGDDAIFF